jgi:hypothetical protein
LSWFISFESPYDEERCQKAVQKYSDDAKGLGVRSVSAEVLVAGAAAGGGVSRHFHIRKPFILFR